MTPTQLTLRKLRADGWTAEVVERRVPFNNVTQDFLGIIDIIALRGPETLAVQCTSAPNVASRVHKIADSPHIAAVRQAGWTVRVWGWGKNKSNRWELKKDIDCS